MALEQLRAFRAGTSQSELGETRRLDPDGFPLLVSSPLQRQHEDISALLRNQGNDHGGQKLMQDPVLLKMLSADTETRTGYFLALLERAFACDCHLSTPEGYGCKRRLKSTAGGARKVRHLPGQRELVSLAFVKPMDCAAR